MNSIRERVIKHIEGEGYIQWRYDIGARTGELSNVWKRGPDTLILYSCMFDYRRDGELRYHGDMIELLR